MSGGRYDDHRSNPTAPISADVWWGGDFNFQSVRVFGTYVISNVTQTISLSLNGDDGNSAFVNGTFVAGGGFGVVKQITLTLSANTPVFLEIVGYNYGGGSVWLFGTCNGSCDSSGWTSAIEDLPGITVTPVLSDVDADGVLDVLDNCPSVYNPDQLDANADGFGDACVAPDVNIPDSTVVGDNVVIGSGTNLNKESTVGDNTTIGANVDVGKGSVIGADTDVGSNTTLAKETTVSSGVSIGDGVVIAKGVVIGENVHIGNHTNIKKDVIVGNNVWIGANVLINIGAHILDNAVIPDNAVVPMGATVGP